MAQSRQLKQWRAKLDDARRHAVRVENGRYHLPVRDKHGRITPRGRWLNEQRRSYHAGRMDALRCQMLETSGFELAPARGRRTVRALQCCGGEEPKHAPSRPSTGSARVLTGALDDLVARGEHFGVIYADPPWRYDNQGTRAATGNHYEGMSLDEMAALPVNALAAPDCYLHMWTTNGFLRDAFDLVKQWGFTYKSNFVWVKPQMGLGNYWRVSHKILLLGRKGAPKWRVRDQMSWAQASRTKHSAKPEVFRHKIESASEGPYLELFARRAVPGWTVWGNQIDENDLVNRIYLDASHEKQCNTISQHNSESVMA